jgi:hypothetical protein
MCWTVDLSEESAVAAAVVRFCGVEQHHIIAPTFNAAAERLKNQLTWYSSTQHGWVTGCLRITAKYSTIYDGIAGDVLSAGLFLNPQAVRLVESGRIDEYVEFIVLDVPCLNQELFPRADALERVSTEFRRYLHLPDPISAFWFFNRTRRDIATSAYLLIGRGKRVMTPFLDDDLLRLLLSLPARMTLDRKLHTDTISKAFPKCSIPYSRHLPPPAALVRRRALEGLWFAARHNPAPLQHVGLLLRLGCASLCPSRDHIYLARMAIYCWQVSQLAAAANPAKSGSLPVF